MSGEKVLSRREIAELCGCKESEIPSTPVFSLRDFEWPGPVCEAYGKSEGPIDGIMGPGGSGKTIGSFFKVIRFAIARMPACTDGIVRVRATVIRDNYRSLYRTTLRSWFEFFPPNYLGSTFTGGADRPAQHRLRLSTIREINGVKREVPVDLEADFFAVGDVAIEVLLKSYETSIGYVNEADQVAYRVVQFLFGRTGRYPALSQLPPGAKRPRVVAFDMNPPKPNHPLLKAAQRGTFKDLSVGHNGGPPLDADLDEELGRAKAINFFVQPSGLSDKAENRRGKTRAEYLEDMRVMTEEDARRMVLGLPGFASDGKPVFAREFRRDVHVAKQPLAVIPGLPLHIGFDQGLSPAAVFAQQSSFGQIRILREIYLGHNVGYQRFLQAIVPLLTQPPLAGLPPGTYTADPAGFYGADKTVGELAWAQTISAGLRHPVYPAPTNEPGARWEAVRLRLNTWIDADTPGLIVDPSCEWLIEGFEAEYKFPRYKEGAASEFGNAVVDNHHHNPHDALQYLLLGIFGRAAVIDQAARVGLGANVTPLHGRRGASRPSPGGWEFSAWND
jgi:hypothetical protein